MALGTLALACGGSAFTTNGDGGSSGTPTDGGSDTAESGTGGVLGRAGRGGGGKNSSGDSTVGGEVSAGGVVSVGGDVGIGGDLVTGGSLPVAGATSTAGTTSTGGTGPQPFDEICPKVQPTPGGACADGLSCSYGTDVRTACRPLADCSDGVWSITQQGCEPLDTCDGVQTNTECDPNSKPCMLAGDQGIYCVCTDCSGAGGPCNNDTRWACAAGSGGALCPTLPPNLGATCTVERQCAYGSCSTDNGVNAACDGSTWAWHGVACPG